ncbi:MAG TPA: NADPH:quinone oxidoreductase family protein [Rhizomicrobium sp.]|nr:NADPH:quinone oxidoreductase family protein [Rhizomicrobium sp.]
MKAYRAQRLAGLEMLALEEVPTPSPPTGAVAIAVRAAGLHLADFAALSGDRAPRPELPFTPGLEVAGTVGTAGAKGLRKGQRVAAFVPWGGLAEQALTPAELCVAVDDTIDDAEAASLPIAYAGAILALRDKARLEKGETVMVLGAGGHIGLAAAQVAKQLGARVIAVAAGERGTQASEMGADHAIDSAAEPLDTRARELTGGKGVDVIFDPVGGDAFEAAISSAAIGGRVVCAGFASGRVPRINVPSFFSRDLHLVASNLPVTFQSWPALARAALEDAAKWAAEKKIRPRVAAKFPLAEARNAFEYVKSRRGNGAVIVTMG